MSSTHQRLFFLKNSILVLAQYLQIIFHCVHSLVLEDNSLVEEGLTLKPYYNLMALLKTLSSNTTISQEKPNTINLETQFSL